MNRPNLSAVLLLFLTASPCLFPLCAQAQRELKWENSVEPSSGVQTGDTVQLIFKGEIPKGFHIYSSKETAKEGPLVTTITVDKTKGLEVVGELMERDGELHTAYDDIFETEIYEYYDKVTFYVNAIVTKKCFEASGVLEYGVCNDMGCMPGANEFIIKEKVKK